MKHNLINADTQEMLLRFGYENIGNFPTIRIRINSELKDRAGGSNDHIPNHILLRIFDNDHARRSNIRALEVAPPEVLHTALGETPVSLVCSIEEVQESWQISLDQTPGDQVHERATEGLRPRSQLEG
jgi:hypothetical protein